MKKLSNGSVLLLLLLFIGSNDYIQSIAAPPATCDASDLGIAHEPQRHSYWCWAASIQMAVNYLDTSHRVEQCEIVAQRYNVSASTVCDCLHTRCVYNDKRCKRYYETLPNITLTSTGYDYQSNIDTIQYILTRYSLTSRVIRSGNANALADIKSALCNGKPVIALLMGYLGGGHVVLISGYQKLGTGSNTTHNLIALNPLSDRTANCKACRFALQVDSAGNNVNSYAAGQPGTYIPLAYITVQR